MQFLCNNCYLSTFFVDWGISWLFLSSWKANTHQTIRELENSLVLSLRHMEFDSQSPFYEI